MKRTTVLLDEDLLLAAQQLARREGKSFTDVLRESLAEHLAARSLPTGLLALAGIANSGEGDLSERVDEILRAETDPIYGWSHRRRLESYLPGVAEPE